ncbi:hypothetical protein HDE_07170 [Halotydeus destructor]|nr:hypothetical protein HDE_07170 [Halotydeus destructor]
MSVGPVCLVCGAQSVELDADLNDNVLDSSDTGDKMASTSTSSSLSESSQPLATICCHCISEPSVDEWASEVGDDQDGPPDFPFEFVRDDIEILVDIYLLIDKTRWILRAILW